MKRMLMIAIGVVAMLSAGSLIGAARVGQQQEPQDSSALPDVVWKRGLAIAPVPLNLEGRSRRLVGLGSYIVNAQATCSDCHTNPQFKAGGNPFKGEPEQTNTEHYLAGGRKFLNGTITSRNITPEPPGNLPAGLTFDQFVEVMRTGRDFDNLHPQIGPKLQVMSWPWFSKMTDQDLSAIYEYLSAIPHADPAP